MHLDNNEFLLLLISLNALFLKKITQRVEMKLFYWKKPNDNLVLLDLEIDADAPWVPLVKLSAWYQLKLVLQVDIN